MTVNAQKTKNFKIAAPKSKKSKKGRSSRDVLAVKLIILPQQATELSADQRGRIYSKFGSPFIHTQRGNPMVCLFMTTILYM